MRESAGSLRAFFLIVGVYGCYSTWSGLGSAISFFHEDKGFGGLNLLLMGVGGLLSLGYVYLGVQLPALLAMNPSLIKSFIYLNILVNALASGLLIFIAPAAIGAIGISFSFGLLINLYLLSSVTKLSGGR